MKSVKVEVVCRGISPLLIHRFSERSEDDGATRRIKANKVDPRQEAERVTYKTSDGQYYLSAFSIPGCMAGAGSNHKQKGSRRTLRFIVPSAIIIESDAIIILDDQLIPSKSFEVDSRPVCIPATKGRIMCHRPRWNSWKIKFNMNVDTDLLSLDDAQMLLTEGGQGYGIGSFRPSKGGPFGRFVIESWKQI